MYNCIRWSFGHTYLPDSQSWLSTIMRGPPESPPQWLRPSSSYVHRWKLRTIFCIGLHKFKQVFGLLGLSTNKVFKKKFHKIDCSPVKYLLFGSVKEPKESLCLSVCLSVCLSGTSLSKALNLHLSLIGQSQICLRSVSGQSQVSLSSLS